MSNKKWRAAAGSDGESPADTNTSNAAHVADPVAVDDGAGREQQVPEQPEAAESYSVAATGDDRLDLNKLPHNYLERQAHGDTSDVPPGVYRTAIGGGLGVLDLRMQIGALGKVGKGSEPMTEAEVHIVTRDSVRFLWQVMSITSRIVESVPLGELRKVVASDIAMPGDAIMSDGTISRHQDAFEVEDEGQVKDTPQPEPETVAEKPKKAGRPRGAKHPLMALINMGVQAARLIKQITSGTHPLAHNKVSRDSASMKHKLQEAERWLRSIEAAN